LFIAEALATRVLQIEGNVAPSTVGPNVIPQVVIVGAVLAAVLAMVLAVTVLHGVLRPVMIARGVTPWRLRDSVGAAPLVLAGSAGLGLATGPLAMAIALGPPTGYWIGGPLAAGSWLVLLLGIMELRKLH
jgi:hypothetical protein